MNREEFEGRVSKQGSGCWIWQKANRGTYGALRFRGKVVDAHRVSYTLYKGEIPEGMLVCHICDVGLCVNPEHLFLGTYKDNMQDCKLKNRISHHENLQVHPSLNSYKRGCRCSGCKEFQRVKVAKQRARRKQET